MGPSCSFSRLLVPEVRVPTPPFQFPIMLACAPSALHPIASCLLHSAGPWLIFSCLFIYVFADTLSEQKHCLVHKSYLQCPEWCLVCGECRVNEGTLLKNRKGPHIFRPNAIVFYVGNCIPQGKSMWQFINILACSLHKEEGLFYSSRNCVG